MSDTAVVDDFCGGFVLFGYVLSAFGHDYCGGVRYAGALCGFGVHDGVGEGALADCGGIVDVGVYRLSAHAFTANIDPGKRDGFAAFSVHLCVVRGHSGALCGEEVWEEEVFASIVAE